MKIISNTEIVTGMRNKFLFSDSEGKTPIDLSIFGRKCCVYIIKNLINNKIYVGKTVNILNRANMYIYHYRHNKSKGLIDRAIANYGIENFIMFPIAMCNGREELCLLEKYYIDKLNTTDRHIGYNIISDLAPEGHITHKGHPHSIATKITKSKFIAAVNLDTKELVISVGMKIFGDYIGKGKDIIKNAARAGTRICGFYIIYLNYTDMEIIENKHMEMRNEYNSRIGRKVQHNQDTYLELVSEIKNILDMGSVKDFVSEGFKCSFLTYNSQENIDNGEPLYQFLPVELFLDYYLANEC